MGSNPGYLLKYFLLQLYFISFVQGISESYLLCFQSPWRLVGVYCIGRRHGIRIDSVHVKSYCLCIKHLESGQALYIEKKDKRQQHSQLDMNWAISSITYTASRHLKKFMKVANKSFVQIQPKNVLPIFSSRISRIEANFGVRSIFRNLFLNISRIEANFGVGSIFLNLFLNA